MISNKALSDDLKIIKELVIKGFTRLDSIDNRLNAMDIRLNVIDERLDTMDIRFDAIDTNFNKIDSRFDRIENKLEKLDKKIDEVKIELKADIEDLAGMTAREFTSMRSGFSVANH